MQINPFYSAYKILIHRFNFDQFNLSADIEKNPGPSFCVDATNCQRLQYEIHFILCSSKIESSEREARKHRYSSFEYCEMEPLKKKNLVTRRKGNRQIGV